jgi:hypothetical protein
MPLQLGKSFSCVRFVKKNLFEKCKKGIIGVNVRDKAKVIFPAYAAFALCIEKKPFKSTDL